MNGIVFVVKFINLISNKMLNLKLNAFLIWLTLKSQNGHLETKKKE